MQIRRCVFFAVVKDLPVIPPEPPIASWSGRNGAQQARARLGLARRSEPLPESTVLAFPYSLDGRLRWDHRSCWWAWSVLVLDSRADDSLGASATIDHTDMRGLEPHGHDPSGAASD